MTAEKFRSLALSIPGASESAHMGHPDFRLEGRVFATLGYPDERHGMVKLASQRKFFVHAPVLGVVAELQLCGSRQHESA